MGETAAARASFPEIVASVAVGLSLEQGPDEVLDSLLEGARHLLGSDARAFWELNIPAGRIVCRWSKGLSPLYLEKVGQFYESVPEVKGTVLGDLLAGQPVAVEDAGTDPRIHPLVVGAGYRAALFSPVMVGGVPHGALAFYYREPRTFSPADLEHSLAFAAVAALAVRHSAIVQDQARALTEARLLLESSETVASSLSLDEILDELLELCPRGLGFVGCRIYLLEDDGLVRVRPRAAEGEAGSPQELPEGFRLALESGEIQQVFDPDYMAQLRANIGQEVCCALVVPLLVQGRSEGLFVVGREPGRTEFDRADRRLLKGMARHAAVAIERASLVEGLERSRLELQRLAESLEDRVRERTRELDSAHQELMRSERMASLGRLAATVAHELRNPLAVIRTSAYYLRNRLQGQGERIERHLEMVDEQVRLAGKIISDILDFSRDVVPDRAPMDVNRTVHGVLARVAVPPSVQVVLELQEDLPALLADEVHVEQCIRNLVHNALEAMPDGGVLTLRSHQEDGWLCVEVRDTGEGILPEDQERIFDPMYTTRPDGNGLGLTLTRKLVRGHDGNLELQSERGAGTSFRMLLPTGASS